LNKKSNSSDGDKQMEDMAMVFIGGILVLLIAPIFIFAVPVALLLSAFLDEDNGYSKFGFGVFFSLSFYFFLLGSGGSFYQGLLFTGLDEFTYGLFKSVMSMKPGFLKVYPKYPVDVRSYLYLSLPASIALAIYFNFRSGKKTEKVSFEQKKEGVFSSFLKALRFFGLPFDVCFRFGLRAGKEIFTSKLRVLMFAFNSLLLGFITAYLVFGPINSWHIHFGFLVNKWSPGLFRFLSPEALNVFKFIVYYSGFLYIAYLLVDFKNIEVKAKEVSLERGRLTRPSLAVYLGKDHNGKRFELKTKALNHHVHVVGATGFGKTVFLTNIIKAKIESGEGLIFTDLKGDVDTVCEIISYVKESGRGDDFEFFSISEDFLDVSTSLSIFNQGNSLEIKDKIMGAFKPEHDYYKRRTESFLTIVLRGLVWLRDNKNEDFDFNDIYKLIGHFDELEMLSKSIDDSAIAKDIEGLITDKKLKEDLIGLKADIESLIKTDFGFLLQKGGGINFFDSIVSGKIVLVHLDSQRYEATAEKLGRLILQDIKTASAKIVSSIPKNERKPFTLIVDEFANLATEQFVGFLNRARASGIGIVVAHQELSDLDVFSPTVKNQVIANTSTLVSFLQKLPESAEIIAGIAGTYKSEKETAQFQEEGLLFKDKKETGLGTVRSVDEYIVHPNKIKNLGVGECFVISKYPPPVMAKVFVNKPSPMKLITVSEMMAFLAGSKETGAYYVSEHINSIEVKPKSPEDENKEGDWLDA